MQNSTDRRMYTIFKIYQIAKVNIIIVTNPYEFTAEVNKTLKLCNAIKIMNSKYAR